MSSLSVSVNGTFRGVSYGCSRGLEGSFELETRLSFVALIF